jgi:hypothetical protein
MSGSVFKGTPEAAALLNPFIAPSVSGPEGVPLGPKLETDGLFAFDPGQQKEDGKVEATTYAVIGSRDSGKTTLTIALGYRLSCLQAGHTNGVPNAYRVLNDDRRVENGKPERQRFTEKLRCKIHPLGREASFNPFDVYMGLSELDFVEIAINLAEQGKEGPLTEFEPLVLQVAVSKMWHDYLSQSGPELLELLLRSLSRTDIDDYYERSNRKLVHHLNELPVDIATDTQSQIRLLLGQDISLPWDAFQLSTLKVSGYMGRVLHGDFGGIIGSANSLRSVMTQPMVTYDWTNVTDKAQSLIVGLFEKFQTVATRNNDLAVIPHLHISDEVHQAANNLMYLRFASANIKAQRARHTTLIHSTQYRTDFLSGSDAGTERRALAENIQRGFAGYFIGRHPLDAVLLDDLQSLGMSRQDVEFTTTLQKGQFGFLIPGRPIEWFQLMLLPSEWDMIASNAANKSMMDRIPFGSAVDLSKLPSANGHQHLEVL